MLRFRTNADIFRARRLEVALGLAVIILHATFAHGMPRYRVTDLGDFPGGLDISEATGINDSLQVVGVSFFGTGFSDRHAFLWTDSGGLLDLGALPGSTGDSRAASINNSGQVVGNAFFNASGMHAFLWEAGSGMSDLGGLCSVCAVPFSSARDINDAGQVVGFSVADDFEEHAFIWQSGLGMSDLGVLPGLDRSDAKAVNRNGDVVGMSSTSSNDIVHAFLWTQATGMLDLGDFPGGDDQSIAFTLNDLGQVVGEATAADGHHVFRWSQLTGMIELFPGTDPMAINNRGQIVGGTGGTSSAYLWDPTRGLFNLESLILPSDPLYGTITLDRADDINDAGYIVGRGVINGATHAYLLSPVGPLGPPINFTAQLTTGSPVSLYQTVSTPLASFDLEFSYLFETTTGDLSVLLDGQEVFSVSAPSILANDLMTTIVPINGALLGLTDVTLEFVLDGPTGSIVQLDDIVFPGLLNGDFDLGFLDPWKVNVTGNGDVSLLSQENSATIPEPSTGMLWGLLVGIMMWRPSRRVPRATDRNLGDIGL